MQVLSELKHRGVSDILVCCVDGLKGFPEAIEAIFPETIVQTCIVHLIRYSLKYVPRRQYDQVTKDLKPIYTAGDADLALLGDTITAILDWNAPPPAPAAAATA